MLSLNDLRSPAAGLDWHEAVAVGAALGTLLVEAQAHSCPRPADVTLLPSGDLRVTGSGHADGSAAAGVAHLLGQLLEAAPHPAELRLLVEACATDARSGAAGIDAVADFVSELAFFERPGRREVLSAVALRAEPAIERARRTAALDALTERTRLAAATGAPPAAAVAKASEPGADDGAADWDQPDQGGAGRLIVPAAVGLTAFLAVAYGATAWFDRPAPPTPRAEAVEDDLPISAPGQRAAPSGSPASAPRPRPSVAPPRDRPSGAPVDEPPPGGAATPAAPGPAPGAPPAPSPRTVDVLVAERDGRVLPSTVAPQRPASRAVPSGHVYQADDPQVTPAVLIRPHLPDSPPPDVPEEQVGTLEFVVTESGTVEHVHLVSPANRYQERMLVAAAKNWQFRPATRDGRPVRFRIRIRVTL